MVDIFSTHTLNRVVSYLDQPASFLLDTFFPDIQEADTEEIHFDIDQSKPRLTPFVSPLLAGQVVDNEGYETKSFKPAYAKDKRRFDPNAPLKRSIGEQIGGSLSPAGRREAALNRAMTNQLENLTRRETEMASQALRTGKITVSGENYPTVVVDFQRDAALTVTLTGANRWGEAGVNILDDVEDWAALVQEKSGASVDTIVLDPKSWRLFRQSDQVKEHLDSRRGGNPTLQTGPQTRRQGNEKARFAGAIGDFDVWVYSESYVDDAGATQNMLPDYSVLLGSSTQTEGTRCYGVIQDEEAQYRASRYFSKSWLEKDPAVRWLLLQSAPLVVPYRPNATFSATVR